MMGETRCEQGFARARKTGTCSAGYFLMKRLGPSLVLILGWALAAQAAEPGALTTLLAVHKLPKAEANRALPVSFEGTVTYYHPAFRYLFVQDGDVAIFVFAP